MDLLINYPVFRWDIEDSFKDLIQEFHLKILELHEGCYLLKGEKCNIKLTYDRGDISCDFKQVTEFEDCPGYGVCAVYNFLYPLEEGPVKIERVYDAKLQLIEYSDMVKNLKNVLYGDFSWLRNFVKKKERENKKLNFVMTLDNENSISKKFWSGDISWQQDIEKYLNESNVKL